jgi:hypothetical protein
VSSAINQRWQSIAWQGTLFNWEQAQLVWAAYGFSYYLDGIGGRHRTVPSSHGTYPLRLFAVNATGIYEYVPEDHMLKPRCLGDFRQAVGTASRDFIAAAPLLIVPVLNVSMVDEQFLWPWYYEGGAVAHNVLLEASAWNLSATIISALNHSSLNQILKLDSEYLPLLVIPTGRAQEIVDDAPPTITIIQPVKNTLFVFGKPIMPLPREEAVIIGPLTARATAHDDYALQVVHWYIDGKSANLQQHPPYDLSLPVSLPLRAHTLTIKAYDYADNPATVTIPYIKLG